MLTSLVQWSSAQVSISPDVVIAAVGSNATLPVWYEGRLRYVQWFRVGWRGVEDLILGLYNRRVSGPAYTGRESLLPDGSLHITDLQTDDTGNYTVKMSMDTGDIHTARARLRVYKCTSGIDIVFLIDGSGSIRRDEFSLMLNFVKAVMQTFQDTNAAFALMQYSELFKVHFDFNRFRSINNPDILLSDIVHQWGDTHTPTAILKVINELFTERSGARKCATKLLIVITDGVTFGDSTPLLPVIQEAEQKGITRYAIGVGSAFNKPKALNELRTIAPQSNVFQVGSFQALDSIKGELQDKIFVIKGDPPATVTPSNSVTPADSDATSSCWWVTLAVASGMLIAAVFVVLGVVYFYERRGKKAKDMTSDGSRSVIYAPTINYVNVENGNQAQTAVPDPDADHPYMALKHEDPAIYSHLEQ